MKMRLCNLVMLACLALLSACAPPSIPYDRGATPAVQSIGILSIKPPDTPVVVLASTVGQSFGLIGVLVDAGMMQARDTRFREMLESHQYSGPEHFSTYLREAVAAQNYQVSDLRYRRISDDYLADYKTLNGADAWLDCANFAWGYLSAGIGNSTPYRPAASVRCGLVRASDGSILMRDIIMYNSIANNQNAHTSKFVTIAPDPSFAFTTFDNLVADPDLAIAGVDAAMRSMAQAVATLLR